MNRLALARRRAYLLENQELAERLINGQVEKKPVWLDVFKEILWSVIIFCAVFPLLYLFFAVTR